jgi:hypothetical protein
VLSEGTLIGFKVYFTYTPFFLSMQGHEPDIPPCPGVTKIVPAVAGVADTITAIFDIPAGEGLLNKTTVGVVP